MASLGEYGSLLQLGFGIGIGLSVFRAPLDLISKGLADDLNAEMGVVENVNTAKARRMMTELVDLKISLSETVQRLERLHVPFLIAAVFVAIVNWFLLWRASTTAGYQLSSNEEWALFY